MPTSLRFDKPQYAKARRKVKRQRQEALSAAIAAVWLRDGSRCVACGYRVNRTSDGPSAGEVNHIVPRSQSKALREDVTNMELLCRGCHRDMHAKILLRVRLTTGAISWERRR